MSSDRRGDQVDDPTSRIMTTMRPYRTAMIRRLMTRRVLADPFAAMLLREINNADWLLTQRWAAHRHLTIDELAARLIQQPGKIRVAISRLWAIGAIRPVWEASLGDIPSIRPMWGPKLTLRPTGRHRDDRARTRAT